jgi:hypothetical protein
LYSSAAADDGPAPSLPPLLFPHVPAGSTAIASSMVHRRLGFMASPVDTAASRRPANLPSS